MYRSVTIIMALGAVVAGVSRARAESSLTAPANLHPRSTIVAACSAALPKRGSVFSGPVLQVLDGTTLCVAEGPTPEQWIRVRLEGAGRTASRGALMAASFAKDIICTSRRRVDQTVIARCEFDGDDLAMLAATAAAKTEGPSWR